MITSRPTSVLLAGLVASLTACADQQQNPVAADPSALATAEGVAPLYQASGKSVKSSYIVVLKETGDPRSVAAVAGVDPQYVYESALNGFAVELTPGKLNALRANPHVAYVEEDQAISAETTQSLDNAYGDPWGLDRSDQRSSSLSKSYTYQSTGSGVYVYVIDSGIETSHPEFEGRAKNRYDVFGGSGSDCYGHGTHVAGTIGGKTWGVAKKAYLRGVKVLDCSGSGTVSGFIKAVDWVRKNRANPAVVNMSVSAGYSSSLNTAVTNLVNSGVFVAVAAGNSSADACNYSPSSVSGAFTTAATTSSDSRASYSNHGKCVDGYAPGSVIMSAYKGGTNKLMSGTSMAAPHVAGVAALYKSKYGNASSSTIDKWLKNNATSNVVKSNPSGTSNRLLYKSSL